jgi:hypothetical protein
MGPARKHISLGIFLDVSRLVYGSIVAGSAVTDVAHIGIIWLEDNLPGGVISANVKVSGVGS